MLRSTSSAGSSSATNPRVREGVPDGAGARRPQALCHYDGTIYSTAAPVRTSSSSAVSATTTSATAPLPVTFGLNLLVLPERCTVAEDDKVLSPLIHRHRSSSRLSRTTNVGPPPSCLPRRRGDERTAGEKP